MDGWSYRILVYYDGRTSSVSGYIGSMYFNRAIEYDIPICSV